MKNGVYMFFLILSVAVLTSGCASIVIPYHETPLCSKGVTGGYCASISEVYDAVTEDIIEHGMYEGPYKREKTVAKGAL